MRLPAISFALCFVIINACSQTTTSGNSSVRAVFVASTPCDAVSKTLLQIPPGDGSELMIWNLTLYQDSKTFAPADYTLICRYGLPKQGTKGFMEGSKTITLEGKWSIGIGTHENPSAVVYKLNADSSGISLSFLQPDPNLLHLLDADKRLMIGTGAWSYTLNRIDPVPVAHPGLVTRKLSTLPVTNDSGVVGIFGGRTPCNHIVRELNNIDAVGCQITKWRVTLYQDSVSHIPTDFRLETIYVGKGDNRYTNTGKWVLSRGTKVDPEAIVYQMQLDQGKPELTLNFLKADDNILFFLDKDRSLLVGDRYTGYTLNRTNKGLRH